MRAIDVQVVGLGYVGLPLAVLLAQSGLSVRGVDVDAGLRARVRAGRALAGERELPELLRRAIGTGALTVESAPGPAGASILAVPTPAVVDGAGGGRADLSMLDGAMEGLEPVLRAGDLVVLTSTSPVGTTNRFAAWLAGRGIDFAYAPERVLPGDIYREMRGNDRMVGGVTAQAGARAAALMARFCEGRIDVSDARTAEMVKLAENASRDVAIAFANELAAIARHHGIDPAEVIAGANRHPRVSILEPGIGVGGHCIPVDPLFLQDGLPAPAALLSAARRVNDARPAEVAAELSTWMGQGTLGLLGLTYKPDVGDLRESPARAIAAALAARHPERVVVHDPHAACPDLPEAPLETVLAQDRVAVLVAHAAFLGLSWPDPLRVHDATGRLGFGRTVGAAHVPG